MLAAWLVAAMVAAIVFTTFAEYAIHRLMHWGFLYGLGHQRHHQSNESRTFARDLLDYGIPAVGICWPLFLVSVPAGMGWMCGVLLYATLASYSHQLQHANPRLVFWMTTPVHHMHHVHDMGDHNFGVLVDWWDRLFHTYRRFDSPRDAEVNRWRSYFAIPWR